MRKPEMDRRQRLSYEKKLYRYSTALERGDFDTIIAILHDAESDAHLEHLIMETHQEGYQQEEHGMSQDQQTALSLPDALQEGPRRQSRARARKPRKRWLVALQGIAAVLVVMTLIVGALFIFTSFHKTTVGNPGAISQASDIVVGLDINNINKKTGLGDETLIARDVKTGKQLWTSVITKSVPMVIQPGQFGLTIQDHMVYFASNKQVMAFQAKNGKLLWKSTFGSRDQNVVVGDNMPHLFVDQGRVYASGYSAGDLYTLDAKTGKVLWHYNASIPALLTESNGIAYVLAGENGIKALDGQDGHTLWTYDVKSMPLSAVVANKALFVQVAHSLNDDPTGAHKNEKSLIALNAATGESLWSTIAPADAPSTLAVAQSVVVLFNGEAFCGYRISDGSKAWCTTGPASDHSGGTSASLGGIVYGLYNSSQTNGQVLLAIDPRDGKQNWSVELGQGRLGEPQVIAYGNSLILPQDLIALSRSDGKVLWRFSDNPKTRIIVAAAGQI